jgi:hypothetical protein
MTYIIANLFWIAFSVAVAIESWRLKLGTFHKPGPGFFPFWTAVLLGLLSVISLIKSLKEKREPSPGIWARVNFLKLGLMLVVLFLYAILLNTIGFLPGTLFLLFFLFRATEPYNWKKVLFASLLTVAATYVVFVVLLECQLPKGFLEF